MMIYNYGAFRTRAYKNMPMNVTWKSFSCLVQGVKSFSWDLNFFFENISFSRRKKSQKPFPPPLVKIQYSYRKGMLSFDKKIKITMLPSSAIAPNHCPPPTTANHFPSTFQLLPTNFWPLSTAVVSHVQEYFRKYIQYSRECQYQLNIKIAKFMGIQLTFHMHLNIILGKAISKNNIPSNKNSFHLSKAPYM